MKNIVILSRVSLKSKLIKMLSALMLSSTCSCKMSTAAQQEQSEWGPIKMQTVSEPFDFEKFEYLKSDQEKSARKFILEKFPIGSSAKALVNELQKAGAKCKFFRDPNPNGPYLYQCKYVRAGRGIMALVSSIEWSIIVITDPNGETIQNIGTGRHATGP